MVGRVARMLELVREVRPGDVADLEGIPAEPDALAAAYDRLAAWNFSRDFLARVPQYLMVARAGDLGWRTGARPRPSSGRSPRCTSFRRGVRRSRRRRRIGALKPPPGRRIEPA